VLGLHGIRNSWVLHPVARVWYIVAYRQAISTLCIVYIIRINGSVEVSGSFEYLLVDHT
jgi:hypothetical protein